MTRSRSLPAGRRFRQAAARSVAALSVLLVCVAPQPAFGSAKILEMEAFLTVPSLPISFFKAIDPVGYEYFAQIVTYMAAMATHSVSDPSICYRLEVTNPLTSETNEMGNPLGDVFLNLDLPVAPLGANSVRATVTIELADTNGDGSAFLKHRAGFDQFQRVALVQGPGSTPLGVDLGVGDILAPGVYEFSAGTSSPIAGPTSSEDATTSLVMTFLLSPGDTVLVRGMVVQDDGSDVPLCEIPGPAFITGCSYATAIIGTEGKDDLQGTPAGDIICGGDGDDRIDGNGGNDLIFGGFGRDTISGGKGRDRIYGEENDDVICGDVFAGAPSKDVGRDASLCIGDPTGLSFVDTIIGGDGDDFIGGGPGSDTIRGGSGRDRIAGGLGRDKLFGEADNDRLSGGDLKDKLNGGPGIDQLFGDGGNDKLVANDGEADLTIDGGPGNDTAVVDGMVDPSTIGVEKIRP